MMTTHIESRGGDLTQRHSSQHAGTAGGTSGASTSSTTRASQRVNHSDTRDATLSTSRSTGGPVQGTGSCSASPRWAHSESVVTKMDEMDPLLTALEHAREFAQQSYLRSLEDSINNTEFTAHLTALGEDKSQMLLGGELRPQRVLRETVQRESTETPPTAQRRQCEALQRFVQKVKQGAEAASARAAAAQVQQDERAANINAVDGCRTECSQTSPRVLNDLPQWLDQREDRDREFQGSGYSTTISSFAASRYWQRQQAHSDDEERYKNRLTQSQRRSAERTRREFRLQEADEDSFLVFNAIEARRAQRALQQHPKNMERLSIIDTGTNVSLVPDKDVLGDIDAASVVKIMGFNSSVSSTTGKGTIIGFSRSADGRRLVPLRIENVHHLPGAPHDLLSVSALAKSGYEFHFTKERSYAVTPDQEELELLQRSGLYWLKWRRAVDPFITQGRGASQLPYHGMHASPPCVDPTCATPERDGTRDDQRVSEGNDVLNGIGCSSSSSSSSCANTACASCNAVQRAGASKVPLMLLHRRLAHWNEDLLQRMVKQRALDFVLSDRARCVCDVCRVSKATRRPVLPEREHTPDQVRPFQRVWTDLKGKVCRDFFGNQHMITFTCEVTRWTCVYFAKNKSDVKAKYKDFLKWVELQGYKVEQLNSDGGGEYTAHENAKVISEFQQISLEHGIKQVFTAAYTPEMNGVSERLNRTIVEHTRALLLEAGLCREFWSLAAKHVVYVRNRLWHRHHQSSVHMGASPFQLVYGKAPSLGMLRVWGCDAWKLDPLYKSSSFARKAKKMIFVGMSPNRKGWVLFDPATRATTTTFHCTFDENMNNRRCALRDFDLRQHKAGPGATADENRIALLERSLYQEDAVVDYIETPSSREGLEGAREAYYEPVRAAPRSALQTPVPAGGNQPASSPPSSSTPIEPHSSPPRSDRRIGGSSDGNNGSEDQIELPQRRAAIGTHQDLTNEERDFLKTALQLNLPLVMQQRNPKRQHSESRRRYEKYKAGKTLRELKTLGATWEDVIWDYARGYMDFSQVATSNSHLAALVDAWENRGIESSPAAYVSADGIVNTSSPVSFLSFEESMQQDYAMMAFEAASPRAQQLLHRALGNPTLEKFAHCCASRLMIPEPLTVKEAMASEHAAEWKKAMQEEIDTLTRFNTFETVARDDAQKHGKLVKSKWVFKVKRDADGSVQRFKARLVAKGFTQVPGTDFFETYSPVFSYTSLRTLLAIAVDRDFQLDQWDLKSSFVQQKLDVEHMYMEPPEGYEKFLPDGRRSALHCLQSLYGLKQSSRLLHERLSKFLIKLGFKQLVSDHCVFTRGEHNSQVIVATWVDDIIMASARDNDTERLAFDGHIRTEFEMSPWTSGQADWLLNMNVTRDWVKGTLHLSLPKAIEKLAERFNLTEKCAPYVPMNPLLKLVKPADDEVVSSSEFDYPSAVGGLLYLTVTARPDVAQSVGVLSRFMNCPGQEHVKAAKQVIAYLYSTKNYGITYTKGRGGSPHLSAANGAGVQTFVHACKTSVATDDVMGDSRIMGTYCDADLAGDEGTRKSTTGFCMLLNGGLICWSSKLQATVALSTAEAETIAGTEAVKQLIHLRLFLRELGHEQEDASVVYEDNNAAISLAHGKEQSKRAKHYQLKVHFLNEHFKNGTFAYEKVDTKKQLADAFTKALPRDDFCRYRDWMGVIDVSGTRGT